MRKQSAPPSLDPRRAKEFAAELRERAQAWIPSWGLADDEGDFGRALLEIAARFNSEVAERLDAAGEKMRRGFLDWLAVRGEAARPARMPVVFKLADAAREAVLASEPVRLQADAGGTPVVFETETDVRVVPGRLDVIVGVDAEKDEFYLPSPGLSDLQPREPMPTQWQLKSFASAGATTVQLDPDSGLSPEMNIETGGEQYRIIQADKGIVTIDPGLAHDLPAQTTLRQVTTFTPFENGARNRQEHSLSLGHMDLLNVEAAATIEIVGATGLSNMSWQYWGKVDPNDEVGWQPLTPAVNQPAKNAVLLTKPKGAVEPIEVDGKNSRWIRALTKTVGASQQPFMTDELSIRVNAEGCDSKMPCPPKVPIASPTAEAMANTTPLVLDSAFFPVGKEPRQFDAFYLGSQEAFSKKGAKVQLCFEMADRTFSALAAVREGTFANLVLAGVAKDRTLHLHSFNPTTGVIGKFRERDSLLPPLPGYLGNAEAGNAVALDEQPRWRLPVWSESDFPPFAGLLVGVSAGDAIWVWHEHSIFQKSSGWIDFGTLPSIGSATTAVVDGLVYLSGISPTIAALRDGHLFLRDWPNGAQWNEVDTVQGSNDVTLTSIVPVLVENHSGQLVTSAAAGMLGISDNKKLFHVTTAGVCTPVLSAFDFDTEIRPVAIEVGGDRIVAAVTESDPPELVAHHDTAGTEQVTLDNDTEVLAALEAVLIGGTFHVLATIRDGAGGRLATWAPFAAGLEASLFESPVAGGGGLVEGAPIAVNRFVVIPGARADILISEFDPSVRLVKSADVETGVVVPDSIPALAVNDLMVRLDAGEPVSRAITQAGLTKDEEVFYPIASDFRSGTTGLDAYKLSATFTGTFADPDLTLDSADHETAEGDWLWIDGEFYEVDSITTNNNQRIATLVTPNSNGSVPLNGQYVRPIDTGGRVAPFMRLDSSANGSGDWDASLLTRIPLIFPGKVPREQRGKAFSVTVGNKPMVVVLGEEFQSALTNPFEFMIDSAFGEWRRDLGDTSNNPELSWEYWNGKGWWRLDVILDGTLHLKTTGAVQFKVPADIASSDWAGKTNHWIRARLVGGDYGREKVTVTTKDLGGGKTEQTVERSSEGIRAPSVVKLHISYAVCDNVVPTFVLAQDSGSIRDQSDANRTAGAIVEAFLPVGVMLGRLSSRTPAAQQSDQCPPECECKGQQTPGATAPTAVVPSATGSKPASGRVLFIGLDAAPSEGPVNVLLLVEEQKNPTISQMTVDALIADQFVPVVFNDGTRALGESGVLSMTFTIPPTRRELFGRLLTWLRLTPVGDATQWKPTLRGAYLNAVWASATETLTRELLGSSEGAPNLILKLARPPVLRDTLELRVREPLGEEEKALLEKDAQSVLSATQDLPGDWVLWKQVIDPSDEASTARVYALDESNGEIRFGDGIHGAIPPIGRDSIVAFSYQRTEPPRAGSDSVPANVIAARTALNVVSPVESVEAVVAADQAAGGAPPESDDRVLRFGFARLRHRGRAITAHDLEDLALESSPDIAQACALIRRGYVRLVVVMRGKNPQPSAAQVRELRRLLIAAAPALFSEPHALRLEGPEVRQLRIDLKLRVKMIDHAGRLGQLTKERLSQLFDTATGGTEHDGWPLGVNPSEDDIAFALIDAPDLENIERVTLRETPSKGEERPWPESLKTNELVMLSDDPVRIEFETAEVRA